MDRTAAVSDKWESMKTELLHRLLDKAECFYHYGYHDKGCADSRNDDDDKAECFITMVFMTKVVLIAVTMTMIRQSVLSLWFS